MYECFACMLAGFSGVLMFVSLHVGAEKQIQVPWKNNKYS